MVFLLLVLMNLSVYAQTTWTGAVNSNWFDSQNWTNGVPSGNNGSKDAVIPPTSNNPIVGAFSTYNDYANTGNLNIESGAQLTLAPYGVLGVFGILTNKAGTSGLLIDADESGILPMGTLVFSNDVSINPVPATVKFFSKSYTDKTNPLEPDYKWQYFGIPFIDYVPGTSLGKYKPYRWDETFTNNTNWQVVEPYETMKPVNGYAITQDEPGSYYISGFLNNNWFNNPIDAVLSYTTGNGSDYPGNHILSNPFMFSLNIQDNIVFENMESSIGFYYTGSSNDWSDYSGTSGINPGQYLNVPQIQAGIGGLPLLIPTMQGFLVKANNTQLTSKITFNPYNLIYFNFEPLRAKKSTPEKVYTIIDIAGAQFADKVWLFTETNCTKAFDNGWDSRKIMGSSAAPQLYVAEEGQNFQVSSFDDINGTFLGFRKGVDSEYTLTFTHHNTELAYPNGLYLMDMVAGKTVDISASGSTYNFVLNPISQVNQKKIPSELGVVRFKIITSPGTVTDINNSETLINVFASDRSIVVDNKTGNQAELVLYNVAGKIVMHKPITTGISTLQADVPTGAYIANVIANKTNIKSSIIIK